MDAYIGTIFPVAFNFAPKGWMLCNGQSMNISQNAALYAILGTQYGGDGKTTFNLPNLQGRIPLGYGQYVNSGDPTVIYQMGNKGGSMAPPVVPHTHPTYLSASPSMNASGFLKGSTADATSSTPAPGMVLASAIATGDPSGTDPTINLYAANTGSNIVNKNSVSGNITGISPSIGIQPYNPPAGTTNLQPYLALNYIICVVGYFPPRP